MKKFIFTFLFLLFIPVLCFGLWNQVTLLSSVTATGAGTAITLNDKYEDFTCQSVIAGTAITSEIIGAGDGTTAGFSGTLANYPVLVSSVTIHYTIGATPYTATDDGAGTITGTDISSGTITYSTGAWSLTFTTAPDNATNITADYTYVPDAVTISFQGSIDGTNFADMAEHQFTSSELTAGHAIFSIVNMPIETIRGYLDTLTGAGSSSISLYCLGE